jgi:hypothetical protein
MLEGFLQLLEEFQRIILQNGMEILGHHLVLELTVKYFLLL